MASGDRQSDAVLTGGAPKQEFQMKNILVLIHDDTGQESRLLAAMDLTRALNGHLTCIDVAIVPTLVGDYDGSGTAMLLDDERQRETTNRMLLQGRLTAASMAYSWIDECGFLSLCMREAANDADLIILNRELDEIKYPDMLKVVGEVMIKSRKPIVAVPANATGFDVSGAALIAWDGSDQAGTAMRAAVPLLSLAGSVTILEIDDGSLQQPALEAVDFLARRNVKATVLHEAASSVPAGAIILKKIEAVGASYLVMGGFGHSRFIESAFGGVTRQMLKNSPVPLFLIH
jgi:nucleotide-binding universal stress UspA family protein